VGYLLCYCLAHHELHVDETNWGPRPLRMLKCWAEFPGYEDFVGNKWGSFHLHGWGGFILRQNLKLMKTSLKEWHLQHSQNLDGKITTIKNRILILDSKGELSELHDDEIAELHDLSLNLHSLAQAHNSIIWQISRLHWLQKGDANSKNFHGVMSNYRRHNAISMV